MHPNKAGNSESVDPSLVDRVHLPKWTYLVDPNCGPSTKLHLRTFYNFRLSTHAPNSYPTAYIHYTHIIHYLVFIVMIRSCLSYTL